MLWKKAKSANYIFLESLGLREEGRNYRGKIEGGEAGRPTPKVSLTSEPFGYKKRRCQRKREKVRFKLMPVEIGENETKNGEKGH